MQEANRCKNIIQEWERTVRIPEDNQATIEEKLKIMTKCVEPNCKGFVMSNWECGMCSKKYCEKCHIVVEDENKDEHVCDENVVKTIETIMNTTRPCPTCATHIHKINGCSQMWCPSCKTVFNYNTGNIEKGIIHNPHYFEWIRKNQKIGRAVRPTDTNCNRNINQDQFLRHVNVAFRTPQGVPVGYNPILNPILVFFRLYGHIEYVTGGVRNVDTTSIRYNIRERMKWMLGKINDEEFKKLLINKEKTMKFENSINEIAFTANTVFNDIFHKILLCNTTEEVQPCIDELRAFRDYSNKYVDNICKTYGQPLKTLDTL
jgi:hypothetical protein